MKLTSLSVLILLTTNVILPACDGPVFAKPKYGLQQWSAGKRVIVRIYDLKTKRAIWVRSYTGVEETYPDNGKFFWSQNRRAVAFATDEEPRRHGSKASQDRSLAIWRAGRRVTTVFYRAGFGADYTEDMTWSPQEKYLIIRNGGSGMGDFNLGNMVCLDITTQRTYPVDESIGRPVWISPHTIKFWQPDFRKQRQAGILKAPLPSFWTVPYTK